MLINVSNVFLFLDVKQNWFMASPLSLLHGCKIVCNLFFYQLSNFYILRLKASLQMLFNKLFNDYLNISLRTHTKNLKLKRQALQK